MKKRDDYVYIDYLSGSHGPFLAYVLNIATDPKAAQIYETLPYFEYGLKNAFFKLRFHAGRYFDSLDVDNTSDNTIGIAWCTEKDLLDILLSAIPDPANLHKNTFNKLHNSRFSGLLEGVNEAYNLLLRPGDDVHKFYLREYLKFSFKNPESDGYNVLLKDYIAETKASSFVEYRSIRDAESLREQLEAICDDFNIPVDFTDDYYEAHEDFLDHLPYLSATEICDGIVQDVKEGIDLDIPEEFTFLHQAYINAKLELMYNDEIEMPFYDEHWFETTGEIIEYINDQLTKMEKHNIITT